MIHIPINLWYAEWVKTAKRPFNQILFMIMVAIVIGFFLVMIISVGIAPDRFDEDVKRVLTFPYCLTFIAQAAVVIGQLNAAVFVAQSVGSEYSQNTWKMILPRHGHRLAFLITKMGVAVAGMILVLVTMTLAGLCLSWLGTILLNIDPLPTSEPTSTGELWLGMGITLLPMLLYGSVALLVTVITRSAIAGALLSFFGLQTTALLSPLYGALSIVMPYPHLPNVLERWTFRDDEALRQVTQGFGYPVSALMSIGVILAYCSVAIVIAGVVFNRRDMAGE